MNSVDGKVAVITGGARGIGAATARLFADAGARVIITDLRAEGGVETANAIIAGGGKAEYLKHDVSVEDDWARVMDTVVDRWGAVNILVNNAGYWAANQTETTSVDFFDRIVGINLKGVFLGCKHAIRVMKSTPAEADAASIVNFSSVTGIVGSAQSPLYGMTKGGVRSLSKAVALEVRERGYNIRCNSVHPGLVETPMLEEIFEASNMDAANRAAFISGRNPMGRGAQPIEIARAVLFLASNDSAFVTGTELVVDGGFTAR